MTSSRPSRYYRIGEVSKLTGLQVHVIRHWTDRLPMLSRRKNRSGHRLYTDRDVRLLQEVQRLIQEEGCSLAGARKRLAARRSREASPAKETSWPIWKIRDEIQAAKKTLNQAIKLLDSPE